MKTSKLLHEMAAEARAEVLRIEAERLEARRLLSRRKAELSDLAPNRKTDIIDRTLRDRRQQTKENNNKH